MTRTPLFLDAVSLRRGSFRLDVTAEFPAGKLTVILGPSGSGKTTLLDILAGFVPPDSGCILEGTRDVSGIPPYERDVGVVFQHLALFPHLNVLRNVTYGLRARGEGKRADTRAREALSLVRLEGFERRNVDTISGGERQRVALARALAIDPSVLLLDEPLSSLDTALRRRLGGEIKRIQKATRITTLLVTHDQEEALSLADQLAIMNDGKIVQFGAPRDIWDNPTTLFSARFLGRCGTFPVMGTESDGAGRLIARTAAGNIGFSRDSRPILPSNRGVGTVVVRPENLRRGRSEATADTITGTVVSAVYAGGEWKVTLEAGEGETRAIMEADVRGAEEPRIGETITWSIRPGTARWLPGESGLSD